MTQPILRPDSFVLYKNRPARVTSVSDKKIDVQTEGGETLSLRPKDVTMLHAGPLRTLADLKPPPGDVTSAWELLAGTTTSLPELAELAYDAYTPSTAWAVWQLLADGLYFSGAPEAIEVHTSETVATIRTQREAKAAEENAWQAFLARMRAGQSSPDDQRYLSDVFALALGQRDQSRVLRALGREQTPQNAHALLLATGHWAPTVNPYPQRQGVTTAQPDATLPALPDEPRRDLTHLVALAIDDEGSRDPDDAVSWDNGRLWVHIADVAALIPPASPADEEAQARGANLYLPEGTIHMLPAAATDALGLGLQSISPALSFGLAVNAAGEIEHVEITSSWVRVTRLSYDEAEEKLTETPFQELYQVAQTRKAQRVANGAVELELPEVKIRVEDGQAAIRPLPPLHSRELVREAMLLTGEAVARYAQEQGISVPFSVQDLAEEAEGVTATTLSEMFALRRLFKPGQYKTTPSPHAGLGLDAYVQATSPLRRYTDLVIHQQLRAHLRGEPLLDEQTVMERVAVASESMRLIRQTERIVNQHWKLVYLLQHPNWTGEGVVVEKFGSRSLIVIPELDLETEIYGKQDVPVDGVVQLALSEVDLPNLVARFRRE
ncbi:MAG: RNB domain-containing ribonuclease [Caldilineaceae bacterium]